MRWWTWNWWKDRNPMATTNFYEIFFKFGKGFKMVGSLDTVDALEAAKIAYRDFKPHRNVIGVRLAGLPGKPNFYTFPPRGIGGMILKDNRMIPMSELSHPEEPYRGRTEDRKQETLEPRTPPAGTGV